MEETPTAGDSRGRRGGCLLFLAVVAIWLFLLHGFVTTPIAVLLAVVGATLVYGGLYLSLAGARYVFESVWYAGAWVLGLLLLAGAAATLAPAAPGELLTATARGWELLEARARRLELAIERDDVELAGKIARRGLGDAGPHDGFGIPLLHLVEDPEMLGTLLQAGLDPDARDADSRTLLMKTADDVIRQRLLDAGADPGAGGLPGSGARRDGRQDWLVASGTVSTSQVPSSVSLEPSPLRPGEVGTVTIAVDNANGQDRLLDLRAVLNNGVFFVDASHDGRVADVGIPGLTSTVRWPLLMLPAGSRGELEMGVLARPDNVIPDLVTGDLSVDVRVVDLPQRTAEMLQLYQERAGDALRADAGQPMAFVPLILPLLLAVVFWIAWRRARGSSSADLRFQVGRVVAAASALVCAGVAGLLAWSMIEPYVRFDQASCRVVDRRVLAREVESDDLSFRVRGEHPPVMQGHPVAAVEINAGDEVLIAAGFSTGMATRSAHEFQKLPLGVETACWLDPRDPRRFTLIREPSLGDGVGLAMLLALTVVFGLIATRLGRRAGFRSD